MKCKAAKRRRKGKEWNGTGEIFSYLENNRKARRRAEGAMRTANVRSPSLNGMPGICTDKVFLPSSMLKLGQRDTSRKGE